MPELDIPYEVRKLRSYIEGGQWPLTDSQERLCLAYLNTVRTRDDLLGLIKYLDEVSCLYAQI